MQLWLTFDELGSLLDCDPEQARPHVYANQWERRRASDGITRALLPFDSARAFMLAFVAQEADDADEPAEEPEAAATDCTPLEEPVERRVKSRPQENAGTSSLAVPAGHDIPLPWFALRHHHSPLLMAPA